MRHGIDHSGNHIAKLAVYRPHMNANWNFLVGGGGIVVMGIEVAVLPLVALCDITILVYLIVDLGT